MHALGSAFTIHSLMSDHKKDKEAPNPYKDSLHLPVTADPDEQIAAEAAIAHGLLKIFRKHIQFVIGI